MVKQYKAHIYSKKALCSLT